MRYSTNISAGVTGFIASVIITVRSYTGVATGVARCITIVGINVITLVLLVSARTLVPVLRIVCRPIIRVIMRWGAGVTTYIARAIARIIVNMICTVRS